MRRTAGDETAVTGQLDAVIEGGSRMIDAAPGMITVLECVARGAILNNSRYDRR